MRCKVVSNGIAIVVRRRVREQAREAKRAQSLRFERDSCGKTDHHLIVTMSNNCRAKKKNEQKNGTGFLFCNTQLVSAGPEEHSTSTTSSPTTATIKTQTKPRTVFRFYSASRSQVTVASSCSEC